MSYAFCRVSSDQGGCSLDYQEQAIKELAINKKINIKETIKYSGSAYNSIPEPLIRLAELKNKTIIFYSVDRFSRNYNYGIMMAKRFVKNKNRLYFVVEKLLVEFADSHEWNNFNNYLHYAQAESEKISQRVTDAKRYLRSKGYFTEATAPFGYKKVKLSNGRAKLLKDNDSNCIVNFIEECRTIGTKVRTLNETLHECGGDSKENPIILDDRSKRISTVLKFDNIAELLNDYSIRGGPWYGAKVSKIYYTHSINSLVADLSAVTVEDEEELNAMDTSDEEPPSPKKKKRPHSLI